MRTILSSLLISFLLGSCLEQNTSSSIPSQRSPLFQIDYATGFKARYAGDTIVLEVTRPWPGAENTYTYYLVPKIGRRDPEKRLVKVPVERLVVTSTTHIPSLAMLDAGETLIGFPSPDYISSPALRARIDAGFVRDVGMNESLNTEVLIDLDPDALVGFAVDGAPSAFTQLERAGIPVLYNADWTETHPLGKAEWIKFFGLLLRKEKEADSIFNYIKTSYHQARSMANSRTRSPSVISGAMYRDVWYCPAGESWAAQFLKDANARYLWADTEGTGSLSLSLEAVLEKAREADYWIGPGQFTSRDQLRQSAQVYSRFMAFQQNRVFTFGKRKGPTGGVLYYELAPNRPDLVLRDLIAIFHPEVLSDHRFQFFDPIDP